MLGVQPGTVRGYVREAIIKLNARNLRHAARLYATAAGAPENPPPQNLGLDKLDLPTEFPDRIDSGATTLKDVAVDPGQSGPVGESNLTRLIRSIFAGERPDTLSMPIRGALILAGTVVVGGAFLAVSAGAAMLFTIAKAVSSFTR